MKLRVPDYYDEFQCIADKCSDNCCIGGWEIDIDEDTYERYQQMSGETGEKLRSSIIQTEDGDYCFRLIDGRCPMLTEEGLCVVHNELGEKYLGVVCSQFPRYSEYYGTIKESGIGMACEEAARIMLCKNRKFTLNISPLEEKYEQDSEYDSEYAAKIFNVREVVFKILCKEDLSVNEKLIVILSLGNEVQKIINDGDYDTIKDITAEYTKEYGVDILEDTRSMFDNGEFDNISLHDSIRQILVPYEEMEILNDTWESMLKDVIYSLFEQMDKDEYTALSEEFSTYISSREYEYRQLLEYYVFRYFAKSIYDYDVLGKCQMLVTNFFMIKQMDMLKWLDNHRNYSFDDRMDIVHIFSRQVEYSEENIENLYEDFIFDD
uniref:flagellin lysine-N-methylase n=1 Tax=Lachnospira sp. TaxID=2049031 RepID=UPI003FF0AD70